MTRRRRRRLLGRRLGDVLPHDVEYGRADEAVLDGAGEEEGAGVLDERAHDVGTPALEHVVGALEAARDAGVGRHRLLAVVPVRVAAQVQVPGLRSCGNSRSSCTPALN